MIKYKVIKNGIETNSWTSALGDENYYEPSFGRKAEWVESEDQAVIASSTQSRQVTKPKLDPQTGLVSYQTVTEYFIPAEYQVVQEDITAKLAQDQINAQALAYLASTDWYLLRAIEDSSKPVPADIVAARAAARASIVK